MRESQCAVLSWRQAAVRARVMLSERHLFRHRWQLSSIELCQLSSVQFELNWTDDRLQSSIDAMQTVGSISMNIFDENSGSAPLAQIFSQSGSHCTVGHSCARHSLKHLTASSWRCAYQLSKVIPSTSRKKNLLDRMKIIWKNIFIFFQVGDFEGEPYRDVRTFNSRANATI